MFIPNLFYQAYPFHLVVPIPFQATLLTYFMHLSLAKYFFCGAELNYENVQCFTQLF